MRVKVLKVITVVAVVVFLLCAMLADTEENGILIAMGISSAWLCLIAAANSVDLDDCRRKQEKAPPVLTIPTEPMCNKTLLL